MSREKIKNILKRINAAAQRVNRDPGEIRLVCVTKGIDPYRINETVINGVKDIGENRVQEALSKKEKIMPGVKWHMIGHLQTNKVKDAVSIFDLIHSVDSIKLAQKINREGGLIGKVVEVLIQLNISGEEPKYGIRPDEVAVFLREVSKLENIRILGFMTITPLSDDPEMVRPYLRGLKEIFDKVKTQDISPNIEMKYLSMGMSQDFEVAIEEGANMVRIGTAIFK